MATCLHCDNFVGDPCPSCRTLFRIRLLLLERAVPLDQEVRVLSILRHAACELSDVYEQHGTLRASGSGGAAGSGESPSLESWVKPKEPADQKPGPDKEEKRKKESKKAKKEESKDKKRKAPAAGAEGAPGKREEKEEDRRSEGEVIRAAKAAPADEAGERREEAEEGLQEHVDQYVSSNPEKFGLGSLSVRGSAARHFQESEARGRQHPAEPEGPPPGAELPTVGERHVQRRERSRSGRRKSKGARHRQRGRDFWRQVHLQEQWRRRQPQKGKRAPERRRG